MSEQLLECPSPVEERPSRLSLRDAVRVSGMSEKTLRRKLEAGALRGQRENLDYGGFMWMIEARSLAELYPSPELTDYLSGATAENDENEATEELPIPVAQNVPSEDFLSYILEQNRELRDELRHRDERLTALHERTLGLEREVGEQRGTAVTQARVLEWFQQQPTPQPMLPAPAPRDGSAGAGAPTAPVPPSLRPALLSALGALLMTLILLSVSGHFGP